MSDTYICAECGGEFGYVRDENWNEEKAKAERDEFFPGMKEENMAQVCEDCFKKIMSYAESNGLPPFEKPGQNRKNMLQEMEAEYEKEITRIEAKSGDPRVRSILDELYDLSKRIADLFISGEHLRCSPPQEKSKESGKE